jgi:O-antigen ligase
LLLAAVIVGSAVTFDPWGWAAFGPVKWAVTTVAALLVVVPVALAGRLSLDKVSAAGWLLFIGWGIVAGLVAVDPFHTWIGTPDRHLGLLTYVLAAIGFFAAQQLGEPAARIPIRAAVVALAGIGMYAALEALGTPPVDLSFAGGRLGGTFGSPAYLGAACALLIPVAAGSALERTESPAWRITAGCSVVLGLVAAAGSQTRGAWAGLTVAAVVAVMAARPRAPGSRAAVAGALVVGVAVVALSPLGGRIAATFEPGGGAQGRVDEWQVGLRALGANAATGTGFEGYRVVFGEHVDAGYERSYGREAVPDRAHNGALDVGITTGVPGMALYLGAAGFLAMRSWRGLRSARPWLVGLSAGVVAYVVQQQFLFPIAEVDLALWALAGVVVAATQTESAMVRVRVPRATWTLGVALAAAALAAGTFDVIADRETKTALEAAAADRLEAAVPAAESAVAARPDSIRYRLVAASVAAGPATPQAFTSALGHLERALDISPGDPILRREHAAMTLAYARAGGEPQTVAAAVTAWERLTADDPNNARNHLELGVAYALDGQVLRAESEWLVAADLAPRRAAPWMNLAVLYLELGRDEDAGFAADRVAEIDPAHPGLSELRNRLAFQGVE